MAGNLRKAAQPSARRRASTALDVFINCPFDADYKPIFNAMVYTVVRSGYRARCALETDDAAENRLGKIIKIVGECKYGIHDISRTETGGEPPLPRFNMPLELGLWLGAHHLGRDDQAGKRCIVFDSEPYRYLRFISDIGGQDIHAHGCDIPKLIAELAHLIHGMRGLRRRASRKLLIVFMDWVSTPSIPTITPSHTRHVRRYRRPVPVSSHQPQESHRRL